MISEALWLSSENSVILEPVRLDLCLRSPTGLDGYAGTSISLVQPRADDLLTIDQ